MPVAHCASIVQARPVAVEAGATHADHSPRDASAYETMPQTSPPAQSASVVHAPHAEPSGPGTQSPLAHSASSPQLTPLGRSPGTSAGPTHSASSAIAAPMLASTAWPPTLVSRNRTPW
jgi:hypothetical protein